MESRRSSNRPVYSSVGIQEQQRFPLWRNKFNKQRTLQGLSRQSAAVKHHVDPSVQREGDFRNNDGGLLHLSESRAGGWDGQLRSAQVMVPLNGSRRPDPGECSGYWRGQLHGYKDF